MKNLRLTLIIGTLMAIGIFIHGFILDRLELERSHPETPFGVLHDPDTGGASVQDFSYFWHVTCLWSQGNLSHPYRSSAMIDFHHQWTGLEDPRLAMRFFYHPAMIITSVPLTWLHPATAYHLFAGGSLTLLLTATGWSIWRCRQWPAGLVAALCLLSFGFPATLWIGQLSPLYAACLLPLVATDIVKRTHATWYLVACLVLLSIKPTLVFPLLVGMLILRRWDVLVPFGGVSAIILLISTLLIGWGWPFDYLQSAFSHVDKGIGDAFTAGTAGHTNVNFRNLAEILHILPPEFSSKTSLLLWLGAPAIPFFAGIRSCSVSWMIAYGITTYLIFSPHLNRADEILAVVPLFYLGAHASKYPMACKLSAVLLSLVLFNVAFITIAPAVVVMIVICKFILLGILLMQQRTALDSIASGFRRYIK